MYHSVHFVSAVAVAVDTDIETPEQTGEFFTPVPLYRDLGNNKYKGTATLYKYNT